MTIKQIIKGKMGERSITQRELARRMGCSEAHICKVLKGENMISEHKFIMMVLAIEGRHDDLRKEVNDIWDTWTNKREA